MLKKLIQDFVRRIQKIFIIAALFIVYLIGFGITWMFAVIFERKFLGIEKKDGDTFWVKAEGYESDINALMRGV